MTNGDVAEIEMVLENSLAAYRMTDEERAGLAVLIASAVDARFATVQAERDRLRLALEGHVLLVDVDGWCVCHICHAQAKSCDALKHHASCILAASALPQPVAARGDSLGTRE